MIAGSSTWQHTQEGAPHVHIRAPLLSPRWLTDGSDLVNTGLEVLVDNYTHQFISSDRTALHALRTLSSPFTGSMGWFLVMGILVFVVMTSTLTRIVCYKAIEKQRFLDLFLHPYRKSSTPTETGPNNQPSPQIYPVPLFVLIPVSRGGSATFSKPATRVQSLQVPQANVVALFTTPANIASNSSIVHLKPSVDSVGSVHQ